MERGFCEVRAPEKALSGDGGQQGESHISWKTLAWPVAWEILLPQVPASLQTLWPREPSHLSLSPKPQESPGPGNNAVLFPGCDF